MRLRTIWTIPAMDISERFRRTRDWVALEIAVRLPKRIKFWVFVAQAAHATIDSPNVPGTTLEEMMPKIERPKVLS